MKISEMVRERFQTPKSLDNIPYTLIQTLLMMEMLDSLAGQENSEVIDPAVGLNELAGEIYRIDGAQSADRSFAARCIAQKLLEQYTIERK